MNNMTIALIGLIFSINIPAVAAQEVPLGTENERTDCATSMGLDASFTDIGSYSIRIDTCIRDRLHALRTAKRTERLRTRAISIQKRISRNSRIVTETPAERFDRFKSIYNADDTYRKLEVNKESLRETVQELSKQTSRTGYKLFIPTTTESILLRKTDEPRRSRRLIQQDVEDTQTRASRMESADIYQEKLKNAFEECSHITNGFQRNNCVRSARRRIGSQ